MNRTPKGLPAKEHQRKAVERLANERGDAGAAAELGVSRATVGRIIAGRGLYFATRKLLDSVFGTEAAA